MPLIVIIIAALVLATPAGAKSESRVNQISSCLAKVAEKQNARLDLTEDRKAVRACISEDEADMLGEASHYSDAWFKACGLTFAVNPHLNTAAMYSIDNDPLPEFRVRPFFRAQEGAQENANGIREGTELAARLCAGIFEAYGAKGTALPGLVKKVRGVVTHRKENGR